MTISRHTVNLVSDTGANASGLTGRLVGELKQISYVPGDTGVRFDTGASITLTTDTGRINSTVSVIHLAPSTGWNRQFAITQYDENGSALSNVSGLPVFAGEKITASVQGIATDTGKELSLLFYVCE